MFCERSLSGALSIIHRLLRSDHSRSLISVGAGKGKSAMSGMGPGAGAGAAILAAFELVL